jgi:hypothetical protein
LDYVAKLRTLHSKIPVNLFARWNQNLEARKEVVDPLNDTRGQFFSAKFEFGGSFGMSLEGDCHKVEDTPNLELLLTFGMSSEGVCHVLYTLFHDKTTSSFLIWR